MSLQYVATIRTLRLYNAYFDSELTRLAWLWTIPHVEKLVFYDARLTGVPLSTLDWPQDLLLDLRSIKFNTLRSGGSNFLNFVLPKGRKHITHVALGRVSLLIGMEDWFTDIAAALEHLAFSNMETWWMSGTFSEFVLAPCTNLRSVQFSLTYWINCDDTGRLHRVLRTITSSSIVTLRFNLFALLPDVYDHKLTISDGSAFSALLLSPKFASLQHLSFHLCVITARVDLPDPPLFADLKALLPDLYAQGVLDFSLDSKKLPRRSWDSPEVVLEIHDDHSAQTEG